MKRWIHRPIVICVLLASAPLAAVTKKPSVMVEDIKSRTLADRLLYPASLAAFRIVPVHTDTEGLVSDLRVDLGQTVRAGETLALVTNPDPNSGFKPYMLTAPISGIVTTLDIAVGDRVTRDRVMMVIADLKSFKVKIHVTADDLRSLRPHEEGLLKMQGKSWKVRIRAMSPMIDPATGTASCELEILASTSELKALVPGSLGQVVFEANRRQGIVLTEDALVYRGKDPYVVRVSPQNTAEYVAVEVVRHSVGEVELKGGIKEGDPIVTGSTGFIVEGEALETMKIPAPKGPASQEGSGT